MNDLISREEVITAIERATRNLQTMDDSHSADKVISGLMKALNIVWFIPPSESKTGKWEEICNDHIRGRCSACGWEAHLYEDDVVGMPYCPNCGAKMEVE